MAFQAHASSPRYSFVSEAGRCTVVHVYALRYDERIMMIRRHGYFGIDGSSESKPTMLLAGEARPQYQ
jgi:hypothetical protein